MSTATARECCMRMVQSEQLYVRIGTIGQGICWLANLQSVKDADAKSKAQLVRCGLNAFSTLLTKGGGKRWREGHGTLPDLLGVLRLDGMRAVEHEHVAGGRKQGSHLSRDGLTSAGHVHADAPRR